MITVRELRDDEFSIIPESFYRDVDKLNTGERLRPGMRPVAAFEGDRIVGVWVVMAHVHAGPVWLDEELRGKSRDTRAAMWESVKTVLEDIGAHGATMIGLDSEPKVQRMIESLGGERIQGSLYQVRI